eukprot:Nitzschia sp. Nitz4//scaffold70_size99833//75792//76385//NITZ4_004605-RA/size99833-snap-gene-0.150-mRNA-1//-1//CDS//3329557165//5048//frame0
MRASFLCQKMPHIHKKRATDIQGPQTEIFQALMDIKKSAHGQLSAWMDRESDLRTQFHSHEFGVLRVVPNWALCSQFQTDERGALARYGVLEQTLVGALDRGFLVENLGKTVAPDRNRHGTRISSGDRRSLDVHIDLQERSNGCTAHRPCHVPDPAIPESKRVQDLGE